MLNIIVAIYCIVDDLLKASHHTEDNRRLMSDAEVITTALVAARFFGGNQAQARQYLKEQGLIKNMLSSSRFNRRLHNLSYFIYHLQQQLGQMWMSLTQSCEYLLDSFPVAVCDNIRIPHCRLLRGEEYRGYIASKKRYFYGIRIHLVSTIEGIPVEWVFLPGAAHDTRGLSTLPINLPSSSELYTDKGYTDFLIEDNLASESSIKLMTIRKQNSTRRDSPALAYVKQVNRHYIETVFSQITSRFGKKIHAVTFEVFLLKLSCFIWSYSLEQAFL
jgi:Transposase DDE domain